MTDDRHAVVLNDEEQYSVWPEGKQLPAGWRAEGTVGTRAECIDYIDRVWADMRPRSLRERMALPPTAAATRQAAEPPLPLIAGQSSASEMRS